MKHKAFEDIITHVNKLLDKNNEWENRYNGYIEKYNANFKRYLQGKSKFQKGPFTVYTNFSMILNTGTLTYDLRYRGQSVANISIIDNEVFINTSGKTKSNLKYFGVKTKLGTRTKWNSTAAKKIRKEFRDCKETKGHSEEHMIESELLKEFSKDSSRDKVLCNIQPVTIGKMFFQFATPLNASGSSVKYSGPSGGGIDILARVKHAGNTTHICVMELKDQNTGSEPPEKVILQAIAYATFLARLLRTEHGNDWYKIMGFSGDVPKELILDVVCVMPYKEDLPPVLFENKRYKACKDTYIELHTLFFKEENGPLSLNRFSFNGSLKDSLLKKS